MIDKFENENEILKNCIFEINASEEGKVDYNGKNYVVVNRRIKVAREQFGFNLGIFSEIIKMDENRVIVKATVSIFKNDQWYPVATGHAEEIRSQNEINKIAAIENAETSAIGRSLAVLGLGGEEFASSNEMNKMNRENQSIDDKAIKKEDLNDFVTKKQVHYIKKLITKTETNIDKFKLNYKINEIEELTLKNASEAINFLRKKELKAKETTSETNNKTNKNAIVDKGYISVKTGTKKTLADKLTEQENINKEIEKNKLIKMAEKSEEKRKEDAKVEDAKVEDAKVEDTKVEDTKVEDAKVEDTKVEDAKVEDTKVEDTKVEDTKVEDTKGINEKKKKEKTKNKKMNAADKRLEEKKLEQIEEHKMKDSDLTEDDDILL